MSDISSFQQDQCEDKKILEPSEVCPTCVPDDTAPIIDWVTEDEPYFDARNCEYVATLKGTKVNFNFLNPTNSQTAEIPTLREFAERQIPTGVAKIIRHFNKLEDNREVPAYIPDDGILVDIDGIVKIKVVISAVDFNQIPNAPTASEEPPLNSSGFPSEIIIDDSSFQFHIDFTTLIVALQSYDLKYEFFRQVDRGRLLYEDGSKYVTFRIKDLIKDLKAFKSRLEEYLLKNDYAFSHNKVFGNLFKSEASQVKIELDNSDEQNPMKIRKVFVKSPSCDFVEIKTGLAAFRRKGYYPSAINFMNSFSEALQEVVGEETREWIDFLVDYVYPPIKVDYGLNSGNAEPDQTITGCASDFVDDALSDLGGALEQFTFSALDIFGYEFDKTCSDDPVKNNPAIQKFLNPNKQRTFEAIYNRSIQKIKERERKVTDDFIQEQQDLLSEKPLSDAEREKILEGIRERRREEVQNIRQQAEEVASKRVEEIERINPEAFSHPYQEQFRLALNAKLKDPDSLLNVVKIALEKPSPEETRTITSRLGLCGFTLGLKKAFNCVLKQISYEDALKVIFKSILKKMSVDDFGNLFIGLTPTEQVRIQQEVEKQFKNAPIPWEQQTENTNFTPQARKTTKLILEAYAEAIVKFADENVLLENLKRFPGAELIPKILKEAICPVTPPQHPRVSNRIKSFNLDFCNPTAPVIDFSLPQFELQNPFKFIKNNATAAVGEAITRVLSTLIGKFLKTLENGLCNLLESFGKTALSLTQSPLNFDPLLASFQTAFCPDKSPDEAKDSLNSLLNAVGVADDGISRAVDCLGGALLGTMTKNEAVSLLVEVEKPPQLLQRVADAVSAGCPRLSDLFGTPDRVDRIFADLGNMIPSNIRDAMQDSVSPALDEPIFNSICLTSEELDAWNSTRAVLLESMGINDEDVANQMELYNQRTQEALSNLADSLVNGVGNDIQDGLQNLLNPVEDPNCDLEGTPSKFGSKAFQEPQEVVEIQDQISNEIFDSIHEEFVREFINSQSTLSPSVISKILSDTNGVDYETHNFLTEFFLTRGIYHNSQEHAEFKASISLFPDILPDTGFFPETVGSETRKKILEDSDYVLTREINEFQPSSALSYRGIEFTPLLPPVEKPDFTITYSDEESVGFISDDLTGELPNYSYKLYIDTVGRSYTLNVTPRLDSDVLSLLNEIRTQETTGPNIYNPTQVYTPKEKNAIFNQFLRSRLPLSDSPFKNSPLVYEQFCDRVFNAIKEITVGEDAGITSDGFLFGHEEDTLEEDDLTYVNPESGSTEYTYSEEEKILGRSKTNNPRVFFLDPERHGGSYRYPPLYIAPPKRGGWLGISSVFSPEIQKCDPKQENILKISSIKKKVNDDRSSIKHDNRMSGNLSRCFVHKPFDLIVSKNALSTISGLVLMSIRIKIAEELLKIAPITSHVKFSDRNFDDSIAELIYEKLKKELKQVGSFGASIQRNNYWLLFLEQAVQTFERQEIKKLPKISGTDDPDLSSLNPTIAAAYEEIVSLRDSIQIQSLDVSGEIEIDLSEIDILDFGSEELIAFSYAYQKYGDTIFNSTDKIKFSSNPFDSRKKINLFLKIFCVKYVEDSCEAILKHMVFKELEEMTDNFYDKFEPYVSDLKSYLMTNKDLFFSNKIENFGTTTYEKNIAAGSFTGVGEASDIISDNQIASPWADVSGEDKEKIVLKIERYIRVEPKQPQGESESIDTVLDTMNGSPNLSGVVNLQEFQDLIDENKELIGESYISELFGDAVVVDEEGQSPSIQGSIGLKYGIRIVAKLPDSSLENTIVSAADLQLSRKEKAFYCDHNFSVSNGKSVITDKKVSIPLCSAEVDVIDHQIKDFSFNTGSNRYDLDCLLRKLIDTPEFKLLFELCTPIKGAASTVLCFSNSFFMQSIGKDDGWSDEDSAGVFKSEEEIKDYALEKTKKRIRKFFASFYDSYSFSSDESKTTSKLEFPDLFKFLFGGIEIPKLNLPFQIPGRHKIVKNPFNKDGEECDN